MGFDLPLPPLGLTYPHTAQLVATWLAGTVLALVVLYPLLDWRRTRSPRLTWPGGRWSGTA